MTFNKRLSPTLRTTVLVGLAYVVGTAVLIRGGATGGGGLYLLVAPLLFSVLARQRAGAIAAVVSIVLYIGVMTGHLLLYELSHGS